MAKTNVTVLENGLTVITQHRDTRQPYVNINVGTGSRHENPETAGIAHNLEHIVAGPTEHLSARQQAEKTANMRGYSNASTGYEETNYYYRVNGKHLDDAMQLIADGLQKPLLTDANVDKERGAIISELQMYEGDPDNIDRILFLDTAFDGGNLGRDIGGSVENIERFTPQDLADYMEANYTSDNMVLTVVGDVDHDAICDMAREKFAALPRKKEHHNYDPAHQPYRGGQRIRESAEKTDISFNLAFEGPSRNDDDLGTANLLGQIIGGGFGSRLMAELRTNRGLVYGAQAHPQPFLDTGLFIISAGFNEDNAREAVEVLCDELVKAIDTITPEELTSVKNQVIGSLERQESTEQIAQNITRQYRSRGHIRSEDEAIEKLEAVTLDDVKAFAEKTFRSVPTVTAFGKGVDKVPSYEEITERLGKRRELDASGLARETAPSAKEPAAGTKLAGAPAQHEKQRAA